MSTVGRMAWKRALTKVLTRSRGTPAAALAMYWSRKVLVDTELVNYTPCPPKAELLRECGTRVRSDVDVLVGAARQRGVDQPGAASRGAEIHEVRIRTVGVRP